MSYKEMLINKLMAVTPPAEHVNARIILDQMSTEEVQKAVEEMEAPRGPAAETPEHAKVTALENRIRELEEVLEEKGAGKRFQEKIDTLSKELGDRNDKIIALQAEIEKLKGAAE